MELTAANKENPPGQRIGQRMKCADAVDQDDDLC